MKNKRLTFSDISEAKNGFVKWLKGRGYGKGNMLELKDLHTEFNVYLNQEVLADLNQLLRRNHIRAIELEDNIHHSLLKINTLSKGAERTKYDEISDLIFETINSVFRGRVCPLEITFERSGGDFLFIAPCFCSNSWITDRPVPFLNRVTTRLDSKLAEIGHKVMNSHFKYMYLGEIEYTFLIRLDVE